MIFFNWQGPLKRRLHSRKLAKTPHLVAPLARACLLSRQARSLSQFIEIYGHCGEFSKARLPNARAYPGRRGPYFLMGKALCRDL